MDILKRRSSFFHELFIKHRRHIPTLALMGGFLWDLVTLGGPDRIFDNVVFLFYLTLSAVFILLLARRKEQGKDYTPLWQLVVVQFSFGALASGLLILYGISGTLIKNWPFLAILAALFIGNEFLRGRYAQVRLNIALWYVFLFAYSALIVPVLLKSIEVSAFIISSLASVVVVIPFLLGIRSIAPSLFKENGRRIAGSVILVFFGFYAMYFTHIIPPVPLALKDIGIYHSVIREGNEYRVTYARPLWYEFWKNSDDVIHRTGNEGAACFSSVFAPSQLSARLFHRWEYYDKNAKEWTTSSRIFFSIVGGRDEGFRGYSTKQVIFPGKWRCSVETERGALIGRETFEVVSADSYPELISELR
ncbi:MAG: DUF2914 domain-containing protein [Candidatus Paceibacterota bacterium]